MRLSVFLILLPPVFSFVKPAAPASTLKRSYPGTATSSLRMVARQEPDKGGGWSVSSFWNDLVGSATVQEPAEKVEGTTAAEAYAEMRRKVLIKKERQSLEGQLSSLIRIEGNGMSCKAEDCVRRLASELEDLQENAEAFGPQRTGLAGSWKLIYSSAYCDGKYKGGKGSPDRLTSIEDISYVSENYRLSHTDDGVLRVYKRVTAPRRAAAAAAASASDDDTSVAMVGGGGGGGGRGGTTSSAGVKKSGRAAATAVGRDEAKQPLRKRMFFGFLGR